MTGFWIWGRVSDDILLDLEVYRMGGQAVLDGAALYEAQYVVAGLPFTYTPFAGLVFVPFTLLGTAGAAVVWSALSLVALWRTCFVLARATPQLRPWGITTVQAGLALYTLAFLLEPVVATLSFGQINLIIMWAVVEDVCRPRPSRFGGTLVGLAAGIKILPGAFAVYLLAIRRYADAARAVAVAAATVVVGFVLLPSDSWAYWTDLAYDNERVGGPDFVSNQSLDGLGHRIWDGGASRALTWLVAAGVVALGLWLARRLWDADRTVMSLAAMAVAVLLASPISWSHHWVWFVVVGVALAAELRDGGRWDWIAAALLIAVVAVTVQPVFHETHSLIWQVAYQDEWRGLEWLAANAYLLVGVAFLAYAWWTAARPSAARVRHAELVVLGDDDVVG